jgi:hypothetical protein
MGTWQYVHMNCNVHSCFVRFPVARIRIIVVIIALVLTTLDYIALET